MKPDSTVPMPSTPSGCTAPPAFVMWNPVQQGSDLGWKRQWFGHELEPNAVFNVRGIGIREPMFNSDVERPMGTGDWLIMLFHFPARLNPRRRDPSTTPNTLMLWPPGRPQFYSWGKSPSLEPHSWMHVEGSWVHQEVVANHLPVETPMPLNRPEIMDDYLERLFREMQEGNQADNIILQNIFENWARAIRRDIQGDGGNHHIPASVLRVQQLLDQEFNQPHALDDLAKVAGLSRSYLCHQFRDAFGTTIRNYVLRKRMSVAQRMMYDLNLRIGEIADAVGYSDIYQFSRQFKKSFGVSPTQFRQQGKGD